MAVNLGWDLNDIENGALGLLKKKCMNDNVFMLDSLLKLGLKITEQNVFVKEAVKYAIFNLSIGILSRLIEVGLDIKNILSLRKPKNIIHCIMFFMWEITLLSNG